MIAFVAGVTNTNTKATSASLDSCKSISNVLRISVHKMGSRHNVWMVTVMLMML